MSVMATNKIANIIFTESHLHNYSLYGEVDMKYFWGVNRGVTCCPKTILNGILLIFITALYLGFPI